MNRNKLLLVGLIVTLLVGGAVAGWLLTRAPDPDSVEAHDATVHQPQDVHPPGKRSLPGPEKAKIRTELHKKLREKGLAPRSPIYVRIFKQSRELEVWVKKGKRYKLFHVFPICFFSGSLGPKLKRGDFQAPEGFYSVARRQLNPASSYHLSFNVGYPNRYDRAHKRTGSAIMVHGSCVSAGCFAMTDDGVERIYILAEDALKGGQRAFDVHIYPFRMSDENMKRFDKPAQRDFWQELQPGYAAFEQNKIPPRVKVVNGRYLVEGRSQAE